MRRDVVVGILGGVLLALAVRAEAIPAEPRFLSRSELKSEAKQNGELRTFLDRNGYPDVAEVRERLDSGQWENQTVILYYLDAHKEIAFGMAHMYVEDFGSHRFTQVMTDEEVAALSTQPNMRTPEDDRLASASTADAGNPSNASANSVDLTSAVAGDAPVPADLASRDPADRAEAAAIRAEQAAGKVEEAAVRTENAAARAEAVVEKMVAAAKR